MSRHYLSTLFRPRSIAVFGASDRLDGVGGVLYRNVRQSGFDGPVYAINSRREQVQGDRAYPSLEAVGEPVDLALIATPAASIPGIMKDLGEHGVKAAVILSAGFREVGEEGRAIEAEVTRVAREYGIRFIGPNCLGIMTPDLGLNGTFSMSGARRGNLALVSQSGALCTAILDWAETAQVGFSHVISTGISADIDFGEILDYLVADPNTQSILLYIEGINEARRFMSAIRAASRAKPVIVMKSGRHEAGSKAAVSHTGALVGGDDVFGAALCRAGVVRILNFSDLFSAAKTLSSGLRTKGNRLAIVTNGGGPGVMATDHMVDRELPMVALSADTAAKLDEVLPSTWSHNNPIDIIGDAPPARYREAVAICMQDPDIDAVMVILTPQAMTDPYGVAESLVDLAEHHGKPMLTCWMGAEQVEASRALFQAHGIPNFRTPEATVEAFYYMASYQRNQELLLQAPEPTAREVPPDLEMARSIIENAIWSGRSVLTELESKRLLQCFHIPTTDPRVARDADEAVNMADAMGYPVVMKIYSHDITHKSDSGGVRLNIQGPADVRCAYDEIMASVTRGAPGAKVQGVLIERMEVRPAGRELMLGVISDPVFGPAISFGTGGTMVEVLKDRAVALPPLNGFLARRLVANTRAHQLLGQFRNLPAADIAEVEHVLLRVSEMVCELPWLREMDINPLLADEHGAVVLDARVVIAPVELDGRRRYDHMAIHPYPADLIQHWMAYNGARVTIRPIRPEDARIEREFVNGLSEEARYTRFMYQLAEITPAMLSRFTQIDYDREMALIATIDNETTDERQIGVARYITNPDGGSCEFAIVVADDWSGQGVATRLMKGLMDTARHRGLHTMEGEVLRSNHGMLKLMKKLGFAVHGEPEEPALVRVSKSLDDFRWFQAS